MKRAGIATLILIAAAFSALLLAQEPAGPPPPPDPASAAAHRVRFLSQALTLTAAQEQQATTIFTDAANAEATVQDSLRTAHKSLRAAVAGTGNIDQIAATIGTLTAQLTAIRAKADAALYQILTPEQQSKMTQMEAGPGGPGGPGPFRGDR